MKPNNSFSPTETKILKILGRRKMTIAEITAKLYSPSTIPFDAGNIVGGMIRRINLKCESRDIDWKLGGVGAGRSGRKVWKEKR